MTIHRSLPVVGERSDGCGVLEGLHDDYDLFGVEHHSDKLFIDFERPGSNDNHPGFSGSNDIRQENSG
jgi:hypothetical protein